MTSILVINTGGTIGMISDKQTGALRPFDFGNLYQLMPALGNFDFSIDSYTDLSNHFSPIFNQKVFSIYISNCKKLVKHIYKQ